MNVIDTPNGEEGQQPRFLDANIFLRHLTNDNPLQSPACFALIQAIEQGQVQAWTSALVISELVFVLSSRNLYNLDRARISDLLLPLISLPALKLANKRMYRRVFELYTTLRIDYNDAYNAALMEVRQRPEIYSYDADFDRITGIRRVEP